MSKNETCGVCPAPATKCRALGIGGRDVEVHACDEHEQFMDGWLRDIVDESASENAAAERFEAVR